MGEERVLFHSKIRASEVDAIFSRMYCAFRKKEPGYELRIKSETYALLAHLVCHHVKERLSERRYESRFEALEKINEVARYLTEHFTEESTTAALAQMAHLSEGYFCNLFKEVTGKTAKEYVNGLRIKRAEEMLSATDMTVTEIAFCCGFSDANYFTRLFKKEKGIGPRAFRKAKSE